MIHTPGAYLKARRCAAGLSIADVAHVVATDPKIAEHQRAEWLQLIEADAVPANWTTIVALRQAYAFDLTVLERLSLIQLRADLPAPRLCRICAASETGLLASAVMPWGWAVMPWGWAETDLCIGCAA